MTAHPEAAYTMAVEWPDRERDTHPETLAWIGRIEAVRRTGEFPVERRCSKCGETKSLVDFSRNAKKRFGRRHCCKACDAVESRNYRARQKVAAFKAAGLGVAS